MFKTRTNGLRVMKSPDPGDDLLWLLCVQITENDVWDDLLLGLNEKGVEDIIEFVDNVIYEKEQENG